VGTPEEIYESPKTRFVADFIGVSNFFAGDILELKPDGLVVKTAGGLRVTLPAAQGSAVGQRIQFSVRPEKFKVDPQTVTSDWENCFVGRVSNRIYLGDSMHYTIALSSQEEVTTFFKNQRSAARQLSFAVGDQVLVSWHKDDSVILGE
jgi:spermidine/putrescine transport system ATP-binding protein